MGLRIQRRVTPKARVITTLIAVFALLMQPGYGFVAGQVASATPSMVTVKPGSLQGWTKYGDAVPGISFVADANPPLGSGALKMETVNGDQYTQLDRSISPSSTAVLASSIDLSYATKRIAGSATAAPAYVIAIDKDGDLSDDTDTFWAWYEPVYNNDGSKDFNSWNTWAVKSSSKFWFNGNKPAEAVNYTQTLDSVLVNLPDATVVGFTLNMGSGNPGMAALVDSVKTTEATYDFEGPDAQTLYVSSYNGNDSSIDCSNAARCKTLERALEVARDGDTIKLLTNLDISRQITVTKAVTIDGKTDSNGYIAMVYANFDKTGTDNNSVFGLQSAATIKNLRIDGKGHKIHGINAWHTNGIANLTDVTVMNNGQSGLTVGEQANVQVTNIKTENNGWYGINIDKDNSTLTINGVSVHNEGAKKHMFTDDRTNASIVVNDNDQYIKLPVLNNNGGPAWAYYLKSSAPSAPAVTLKDATNKSITDGYIATKNFTFNASNAPAENVVNYNIKYWNDIDGSAYKGAANAWPTTRGANGVYADNFTQGEGVHHFSFSACDSVGRCSTPRVYDVTYDKTAPSAPVMTVAGLESGESTNQSSLTTEWTKPSADTVSYQYKYWNDIPGNQWKESTPYPSVNGETVTGNSRTGSFTEGEGVHYMQVRAIDAAGNVSEWSNKFVVTYDNTAPAVSAGTYDATAQTLGFTAPADTKSVFVNVDGQGNAAAVNNNDGTWTFDASDFAAPGKTYDYSVTATDNVGNTVTSSDVASTPRSFTIAAETPPVTAGETAGVIAPDPVPTTTDARVSTNRFARNFNTVGPATLVADPPVVLGTQDVKDEGNVLGFSKDAAAIAPSADGWKIFGMAWYWLALIVAAVASIVWWIAAAARRRNNNA